MARRPKHASGLCGVAGLLGLVGMGVLAAAPPASASGSPKLYVTSTGTDASNNTCRLAAHPCATVVHALSVAPAGATIDVGAGTYQAPLHITQNVTIVGTNNSNGKPKSIIFPATTVADTDSNPENPDASTIGALVDVTDGATADLSNLVINGSTASFGLSGCAPNYVGLYYHNASGTVSNVDIQSADLPSAPGCQSGFGAYVTTDSGPGSDVNFSGVKVANYQKNGITCRYAGTTCSVSDSTVTGVGPTNKIAQNGIEFAFGSSGSITGSTASGDVYTGGTGGGAGLPGGNQATGILVYDEGPMSVTGNTVIDNDVDIQAIDDSGAISGGWNIENNTVSGATDDVPSTEPGYGEGNAWGDGIQISTDGDVNPTTVSGNTISGNYEYGIGLYGTSHATVSSNTTNTNYDGIYVDSASGALTFTGNTAKHNSRYDFEDTSSGGGDLGTADGWLPATTSGAANTCKPLFDSAPEGLC